MGETTEIGWTDSTFNPWIGCTNVSAACDHCYAESDNNRRGWVTWGPHGDRRLTKTWADPLKWQRKAADFQAKHGRPQRVFCASLADVFDNHKSILPEWRIELFDLIRRTPDLDWQLLTKRPQNIKKMVLPSWDDHFPSNVWIGTTTENQEEFDRRWPHIAGLPAAVRFISYEPALGPLKLPPDKGPNWVICGGESGTNARPMHPNWARSVRDQCAAHGVPFLFKQWGNWLPGEANNGQFAETPMNAYRRVDNHSFEWPKGDRQNFGSHPDRFSGPFTTMNVGKKVAGRLLDAVEHNGMPIYDRRVP